MSLRKKIIFLFGLLAIVPMLVVAGFSYWYARDLLQQSVQEQLQQTASGVVRELEEAHARIDSTLEALGVAFGSIPGKAPGLSFEEGIAEREALLDQAVYLGVRSGAGSLRLLDGMVPDEGVRCADGVASRLVQFSMEISEGGTEDTLEAGFWVSDLMGERFRSRVHALAVVNPEDGSLLYGDGCPVGELEDALPEGAWQGLDLAAVGGRGVFGFEDREGKKVGAVAGGGKTGWRVVATSSLEGVLGSLRSLTIWYWIFVLGLGFFTSLAFSVLIGYFTRSLSELARAAEEIGLGELDPWLPLHTSGELGQLTAAFSAMLARIRQMMAQVDQSGRLAVVGQLSAYLAHEIRNPLSSIKLNLQRLRRWTRLGDLPDFCLEPLEISLREVERLNASVTGVLELSRAEDSPREVVSLHHLVEEAADLLAPKFRRQGVGLSLDLDAEADRVFARVGQVKSAVLNLMVNALEAQPNGGRLEIRTQLSQVPEMGGPVIALHFKDDGRGVPREIRDRIFEPFFTTKPGGSGIGLAMASQSVRSNGGELVLEPSFMLDGGADFVAVFPLAALETTVGRSARSLGGVLLPAGSSSSRAMSGSEIPQAPSAPGERGSEVDGPEEKGSKDHGQNQPGVPTHLLTPEGLRAVLALSRPDSEEVH